MSFLKEISKPKPIIDAQGIKVFRIHEEVEPGAVVKVGDRHCEVKKKLKHFGREEPYYLCKDLDDGVNVVAAEREMVFEAKYFKRFPLPFIVTFSTKFNGVNAHVDLDKLYPDLSSANRWDQFQQDAPDWKKVQYAEDETAELAGMTHQFVDPHNMMDEDDWWEGGHRLTKDQEQELLDKAKKIIERNGIIVGDIELDYDDTST